MTEENSPTGKRYLHYREKGSRVLLPAPACKADRITDGTGACTDRGTPNCVKQEGEKPMHITWRPDAPNSA